MERFRHHGQDSSLHEGGDKELAQPRARQDLMMKMHERNVVVSVHTLRAPVAHQ